MSITVDTDYGITVRPSKSKSCPIASMAISGLAMLTSPLLPLTSVPHMTFQSPPHVAVRCLSSE
jgi:hypothetical protein